MVRKVAERLSRRVVLRRRLPARFGGAAISVSPDSGLRYWRFDLEQVDPNLFNAVSELVVRGSCVWDVGANVGLFSFAAAGLAGPTGRVVALEPDVWLVTLLNRSAAQLPTASASVSVLPLAVSSSLGLAELSIASRGRSSNHLMGGNSQSGGCRAKQTALTVTLDWLLEICPPPDVLKIDVEGLESRVLHGAETILSTIRPKILCEVNEANQAAVSAALTGYGYTLLDADVPRPQRKPLQVAAWNTLAIPPAVA